MQRDPLNNIHIQSEQVMITPAQLKEKLPISDRALRIPVIGIGAGPATDRKSVV